MTIIVEDGTGIVGANSYATEDAAADLHCTDEIWIQVIEADLSEQMLIRATRALESRIRWRGIILSHTQGLGLPRRTIIAADGRAFDGVTQVALASEATSRLARYLYRDEVAVADDEGSEIVKSLRLPDVAWTFDTAQQQATVEASRYYAEIDQILAPIIGTGGFGRGLQGGRLERWS